MQQHGEADVNHIGLLDPEDEIELEHQVAFRAMDAPMHPPPQLQYQPFHHETGLASTMDQRMASNATNNTEPEDSFILTIDQEADMTHIGLLDLEDESELESQVAFRAVDAPMHPPSQLLYEPLHHDTRLASTTDHRMASSTTNNPEPEDPANLTTDQWRQWLVEAATAPEDIQRLGTEQLMPPCLISLRKKIRISHYGIGILPTELRQEVCAARYCVCKSQLTWSSSAPSHSQNSSSAVIQS